MMADDRVHNMNFEAEVRRVAEAVWSIPPGQCQPSYYPNDTQLQELDGIVRLRDTTHLIMATTSTRLDKTKADVKKLNTAEAYEEKNALSVSKWFITEKQLDAQHIDYAKRNKVHAITLEQFRRRFFDGRKYLALRRKAAFGSARNPQNESITIDDDKYVELPISLIADKAANKNLVFDLDRSAELSEIIDCVNRGDVAILIAPFGSGKSITTRQIFLKLADDYFANDSLPIPFALNLREHWGQSFAEEILDRHARSIGYDQRHDLTVAWRSGMAHLLIDGFDEVASQVVIRKDDKTFMRKARREALGGVRDFMTKIPAGIGVLICGRDHYFDDENEISSALSVGARRCKVFRLGEFTEEGVLQFLKKNGVTESLPDWLPRKPLLLGYLIHRELIAEITSIDGSKGFAYAWDTFLTKITEREAALESSTMEAQTLRAVMERLALLVRERSSGTGPVTGTDLSTAFNLETGQPAGESVVAQLQRLPGLTERDQDPGTRSFVDEDMLAALQGSAFRRLMIDNFKGEQNKAISALSSKAVSMASFMLAQDGYKATTLVSVALGYSRQKAAQQIIGQVLADIMLIAVHMAVQENLAYIDFNGLVIDSAALGRLNSEEIQFRGLIFKECMISEVLVSADGFGGGTEFRNCEIGKVVGVANDAGMPANVFFDCRIDTFDQMGTTNAVLQLNLMPQLKALITILRKLYKQAGGGRKMNALFRGITQKEVLDFIEPVVTVLEAEGIVFTTNEIVHPVRKQLSRVERILVAPSLSMDSIVARVRALKH